MWDSEGTHEHQVTLRNEIPVSVPLSTFSTFSRGWDGGVEGAGKEWGLRTAQDGLQTWVLPGVNAEGKWGRMGFQAPLGRVWRL